MSSTRWGLLIFLCTGLLLPDWSAGQSGTCSAPLKLSLGMPLVRVMVNGRGPFTFIVDTGTSGQAIVTPALATALQLPKVGESYLVDLSGRIREHVDQVGIDEISIGGHAFHPGYALVHRHLATAGAYDGILGFALFQDTLLTLDYPRHCLELGDGGLAEADDRSVLPLSVQPNGPMVALKVDDEEVEAVIDSGGTGVNLPQRVARKVQFSDQTEVVVREQTQLGTTLLRGGEMKGRLLLGQHIFNDPFVSITARVPFASIGAATLQDFAITFDQRHKLVRFEAKKNKHVVVRSQLSTWDAPSAFTMAGRRLALGDGE